MHCLSLVLKDFKYLCPANFRLLWMVRISQMARRSNFGSYTGLWQLLIFPLFLLELAPLLIWCSSNAVSGKIGRLSFGYSKSFLSMSVSEALWMCVWQAHQDMKTCRKTAMNSVMQHTNKNIVWLYKKRGNHTAEKEQEHASSLFKCCTLNHAKSEFSYEWL